MKNFKYTIEDLKRIKYYFGDCDVTIFEHRAFDIMKNIIECFESEAIALLEKQSEWVSVKDRLPTIEEQGEKVLIYREMNESQKLLSYSVHDTSMVKYCDKDTHWKPLTPPNK